MSHFADVNDPRHDQRKWHMLSDILTLTICALLSGANSWTEIEEHGKSKRDLVEDLGQSLICRDVLQPLAV
ncbi:MAG: transposase family protein [Aggregatilineales bacterium]